MQTEYPSQLDDADIAFHMTDWVDDLEELVTFYNSPSSYDSEQVADLLTKFLVHVPSHIAAASKLMLGEPVTDVFGIGAVDSDNG